MLKMAAAVVLLATLLVASTDAALVRLKDFTYMYIKFVYDKFQMGLTNQRAGSRIYTGSETS